MIYEIETLHAGAWTKMQWCADHGVNLQEVRRCFRTLEAFLGRSVRIVAAQPDGKRKVV